LYDALFFLRIHYFFFCLFVCLKIQKETNIEYRTWNLEKYSSKLAMPLKLLYMMLFTISMIFIRFSIYERMAHLIFFPKKMLWSFLQQNNKKNKPIKKQMIFMCLFITFLALLINDVNNHYYRLWFSLVSFFCFTFCYLICFIFCLPSLLLRVGGRIQKKFVFFFMFFFEK
ncbi:hypothetical protein RFI_15622, partial [Reticulomyxa filosa]